MSSSEKLFLELGNNLKGTEQSKLFGKPCFKINGKAFTCFYEDEMVFKLEGDHHKAALNLKGAKLFDPSKKKRPMKEWVQIPSTHGKHWKTYAKYALKYVEAKYK